MKWLSLISLILLLTGCQVFQPTTPVPSTQPVASVATKTKLTHRKYYRLKKSVTPDATQGSVPVVNLMPSGDNHA